ncbi:hypothetical protein QJS04_geneDACA019424 [Acorus gramineus]|uniref:Uncharacterized protein n=1 Tax=Acorus gramineus TaxID=55184 RepID=A0AAV9AJX4_ACOGR|nr:hypothetical protein QJS04_geneDACA019424 [Acorus gramineus]
MLTRPPNILQQGKRPIHTCRQTQPPPHLLNQRAKDEQMLNRFHFHSAKNTRHTEVRGPFEQLGFDENTLMISHSYQGLDFQRYMATPDLFRLPRDLRCPRSQPIQP